MQVDIKLDKQISYVYLFMFVPYNQQPRNNTTKQKDRYVDRLKYIYNI